MQCPVIPHSCFLDTGGCQVANTPLCTNVLVRSAPESTVRKEMAGIKEELKTLRSTNDELRDMIENLEKKWKERENEIVRRVTEEVKENIEEMHEKEKRKKNVIVFNVPESQAKEPEEREEEDKELCKKVFQEVLKVENAKVEKLFRIGQEKRRKNETTDCRIK